MNAEMKTWRVISTPENAEYGDESWFVILDDPDIPDDYPIILWEYDLAAAEEAVRYLNMLEAKASQLARENAGSRSPTTTALVQMPSRSGWY